MRGYINIHTHQAGQENAILNMYSDFEQESNAGNAYFSMGLHPWYLANAAQAWESLKAGARRDSVLAIGECGLDRLCSTEWTLQMHYFAAQIQLANELGKPLIIHCVRAYEECLNLLKEACVPVIFHGFNRNARIAQTILDKGFYLSFGHAIFNPAVAAVAATIPQSRLFLETDDKPDLLIEDVYKRMSELKKIHLDALILQLENNFQKIFF